MQFIDSIANDDDYLDGITTTSASTKGYVVILYPFRYFYNIDEFLLSKC